MTQQSSSTLPADDTARSITIANSEHDEKLPHIFLAGDRYTIVVSGNDTAGKYCLIDMQVPPRDGPPPAST